MSRQIFDLIDTAISDWSMSADAMRSRPPEAQVPRRDGAGTYVTLSVEARAVMQSLECCSAAVAEARHQYTQALERLDEALARAPSPLNQLLAELLAASELSP